MIDTEEEAIRKLLVEIRVQESYFNQLSGDMAQFVQTRDRLMGLRSELNRRMQTLPKFTFRRAIVQRFVIIWLTQEIATGNIWLGRQLVPWASEFQRVVAIAVLPPELLPRSGPGTNQTPFGKDLDSAIIAYETLLMKVPDNLTVDRAVEVEPMPL